MNVLVSGNPRYGLAESLNKVFTATFVSRSTCGVDLCFDEGMDEFVKLSHSYSHIIVNSYTEKMNNYSQVRLLHKLYVSWVERQKKGHIICIGSMLDHCVGQEQRWLKYLSYGTEKLALKNLSETISRNRESFSPGVECTYVALGHMHTPYTDRLHPNEEKLNTLYVANVIKWIIEQEDCIESICVTRRKR